MRYKTLGINVRDYLLEWLDIVKVGVKATTFSSYEAMIKATIEPYFRQKGYTLQGLEARHIQQFYSEKLQTVKSNSVIHYHAVIHQVLKYAMKTDLVAQNVAMKVDRPKKNDYQFPKLWKEQPKIGWFLEWA